MAETLDSATEPVLKTYKVNETEKISSRVEIDTSPPFGSVKEAVTHFEGRAFWIPLHVLGKSCNAYTVIDINKVEEQAAELEKDLTLKEQETLNVLKELERAKRIVEALKLKLQREVSECMSTHEFSPTDKTPVHSNVQMNLKSQENVINHDISIGGSSPRPISSPKIILTELNQAKLNLSRTTNDLAAIRASVESLNKRMMKEKITIENSGGRNASNFTGLSSIEDGLNQRRLNLEMSKNAEMQKNSANLTNISSELQQLNFAAEQFIKMAEAAKREVLSAMSEIEQTKTSMRTAQMRWIAAKKMEEAAKAVEAVALAEMKFLSNNEINSGVSIQNSEGISLTFDEYSSLTQKARRAEELSKKKVVDAMLQIDEANTPKLAILKELGKATQEVEFSKKAIEEALNRVEVANTTRLQAKETLRQWRAEHVHRTRPIENPTKFKNSLPFPLRQDSQLLFDTNRSSLVNNDSRPVLRPSISVRDIIGRKQIMTEEFVVRNQTEGPAERQKVSLSQMLHLHRGVLPTPTEAEKHEIDHKQYLPPRKKFGFIHVSIPLTKQGKKRMQASNPR